MRILLGFKSRWTKRDPARHNCDYAPIPMENMRGLTAEQFGPGAWPGIWIRARLRGRLSWYNGESGLGRVCDLATLGASPKDSELAVQRFPAPNRRRIASKHGIFAPDWSRGKQAGVQNLSPYRTALTMLHSVRRLAFPLASFSRGELPDEAIVQRYRIGRLPRVFPGETALSPGRVTDSCRMLQNQRWRSIALFPRFFSNSGKSPLTRFSRRVN